MASPIWSTTVPNVYSHLVYCSKMSTPFWFTVPKHLLPFDLLPSAPVCSTVPKLSTLIWSAVLKMSILVGLLCQNVYSHLIYYTKTPLVYCWRMSTPIWATVPKRLLPFGLLYQNFHLVYCRRMSTPIWATVPKRLLPFGILCQNVYSHLDYFFSIPIWSTVSKRILPFGIL